MVDIIYFYPCYFWARIIICSKSGKWNQYFLQNLIYHGLKHIRSILDQCCINNVNILLLFIIWCLVVTVTSTHTWNTVGHSILCPRQFSTYNNRCETWYTIPTLKSVKNNYVLKTQKPSKAFWYCQRWSYFWTWIINACETIVGTFGDWIGSYVVSSNDQLQITALAMHM